MKVWVVYRVDWDDTVIKCVCSTEEIAKRELARCMDADNDANINYYGYGYMEFNFFTE